MLRRCLAPVASVVVLALAAAAAPSHANFVGAGQDPVGDAAGGSPGRDLIAVALAYDRQSGHVRGGVKLAGAPDTVPANLTVFAAHRAAGGCVGYPAIGFATQTDLTGADWVRLNAAGAAPLHDEAGKLYDESAEEYEATDDALRGQRPNCVIARLSDPQNLDSVYDVAGPFELRGLPELEVAVGKLPNRFATGRARKLRLTVANPGDGPTGRVRLKVKRIKGVKVQLPGSVPSLRAGAHRTVTATITPARRSNGTSPELSLTATGSGDVSATLERRLWIFDKSRGGKGGGGGGSDGSRLCYRYTWIPPYSTLAPC